jgi:hypothetical protein
LLQTREDIDQYLASLPDRVSVCEVGGASSRKARADWIIDILPYEQRTGIKTGDRCAPDKWIIHDICHGRWPVEDDFFDFTICSHVLEDISNPFFAISELMRISPRGYVEMPSRAHESALSPYQTVPGSLHHKWMVEQSTDGELIFIAKDGQFTEWKSLQIHKHMPLSENLIGVFWDRENNPLKAIERYFNEREFVAYRASVEGISEEKVYRQLQREKLKRRIIFKTLRTVRLR